MDTDRELLELAAKAAGIEINWEPAFPGGGCYMRRVVPEPDEPFSKWLPWNPITDDGDALRLAVKLNLQITPGTYNRNEFTAYRAAMGEAHEYRHFQQDEFAATRRAIVRAAAEIGRRML